jgi:XTP/dITP diphosphohydrolase
MPSAAEQTLLLATRSSDKAREIRQILSLDAARIITLADARIVATDDEDTIEAFGSFLANAHAKAAFYLQRSAMPVIADDSGLSVAALGGRPGVRSRRFAERTDLTGTHLDRANNERLLHELADVPQPQRAAHYTCAAVLHLPDGRRFGAIGTRSGSILPEPRGTNGFGYDPLFLDPTSGLSFAEMDPADKNRTSHRARAFRALAAVLPAHSR